MFLSYYSFPQSDGQCTARNAGLMFTGKVRVRAEDLEEIIGTSYDGAPS